MNIFLTFNDPPSGIYSSQVIDVVRFIGKATGEPMRLVAFLSVRNYLQQRALIKKQMPEAIVVPMVPGLRRWKHNRYILKLFLSLLKPRVIIARSVLAANLALAVGKRLKIVYDGRGAIASEWSEYKVVTDRTMLSEIELLEEEAVLRSNFRIGVSDQLVSFWRDKFRYTGIDHVVIPCTLNKVFESVKITEDSVKYSRNVLKYKEDDIVFVYSGSVAGWQGFSLIYEFIQMQLSASENIKLLFLSKKDAEINRLEKEFPLQVQNFHVSAKEVPQYLLAGDYGLLIREASITNRVASPVKFAEYLATGLRVIISEQLGDYSDFIKKYDCGEIYHQFTDAVKMSLAEKNKNRQLALDYFTKIKYSEAYRQVCST